MSKENSKFLEVMSFQDPMADNERFCNKFLEEIGERAIKIEVNYCPSALVLIYTVIYWNEKPTNDE